MLKPKRGDIWASDKPDEFDLYVRIITTETTRYSCSNLQYRLHMPQMCDLRKRLYDQTWTKLC